MTRTWPSEGVTAALPVVAPSGAVRRWRTRRREYRLDEAEAERLTWAWREACEGAGVCHSVETASGTTVSTPHLTSITLGPPTVLIARLLPGQVIADVRRAAPRLAGHLGAVALRVEGRGLEYVRVELLHADPLAGTLPLDLAGPAARLLLGRADDGADLAVDPIGLPHMIVQGQTRSGKSTWLYALIAQLVRHPDVRVAGVDPTGLTLRPFTGTEHASRQVCGLADLARIERVLGALVEDMDDRIGRMPAHLDVLPTGPDEPLIVTVLDEYPALLRAVDAADPKAGKRVRALVARLLAESHKAGHRVILAAQRAEASIVGAAERAQCAGRLSFRVDSPESVRLLHADGDEHAAGHAAAEPGIALCTWPGRPLTRVRGPFLGTYSAYVDAVTEAARPA